jgi:uncharacterized membrane protein
LAPPRHLCRGGVPASSALDGRETATDGEQAGDPRSERPVPAGPPSSTAPARPRPRRYGLLLLILIVSYLLGAFLNSRWINDLQILLFTGAVLLAVRNSPWSRKRPARLAASASVIASVLIIVLAVDEGGDIGHGVASVWTGALLLAAIVLLIRQVMLLPEVTVQSIYGAISAYLIIGLMFSSFYAAMYWFGIRGGHPFFAGANAGAHKPSDFQYFSFTTLTTLGYGDFTAALTDGRAVATLEAMAGQIFLATLVAKLVSSFRPAVANRPPTGGTAESED